MLLLYVSVDNYLAESGRLAFVITQTVFKSTLSGDGFRRFRLGDGQLFKIVRVEDMSHIKPFEGVGNQTATVLVQKGEATHYPVPYRSWIKRARGTISRDATLREVYNLTATEDQVAEPVDPDKDTSAWITNTPKRMSEMAPARGPSHYQGYAGISTWANGIYWIRVILKRPDGLLVVENMPEAADLEDVPKVQAVVEPDLVFPLVRGQDIGQWAAQPSAHILVPQDPRTRKGVDEAWMKTNLPNTYSYLKGFEAILQRRSGFVKYFNPTTAPFYSVYDVGTYTFAPFRVMWRQMIPRLHAAVVSSAEDAYVGPKVAVTQHVVTIVPFEKIEEAMYFCALANSTVASLILSSCSTSKSYGTPTVLHYIKIPRFRESNRVHRSLAELAAHAHEVLPTGDTHEAQRIQQAIDELAASAWTRTG